MKPWAKGVIAAAISGTAGGTVNAFAAIGIAPSTFNLQPGVGMNHTMYLVGVSSCFSCLLGVAMYFQKSPLP